MTASYCEDCARVSRHPCPREIRMSPKKTPGEATERDGARPCDVAWIRSVVEQCRAADVPCFVKQLGRNLAGSADGFTVNTWLLNEARERVAFSLFDRKGGDPAEWPEDLRVREFPSSNAGEATECDRRRLPESRP